MNDNNTDKEVAAENTAAATANITASATIAATGDTATKKESTLGYITEEFHIWFNEAARTGEEVIAWFEAKIKA